jgi:sensor histidine kinase YesM
MEESDLHIETNFTVFVLLKNLSLIWTNYNLIFFEYLIHRFDDILSFLLNILNMQMFTLISFDVSIGYLSLQIFKVQAELLDQTRSPPSKPYTVPWSRQRNEKCE